MLNKFRKERYNIHIMLIPTTKKRLVFERIMDERVLISIDEEMINTQNGVTTWFPFEWAIVSYDLFASWPSDGKDLAAVQYLMEN